MKTPKDIQLAAITFLRAFQAHKAHELEGTFLVFNPSLIYKQHQSYLIGASVFGLLFFYLLYNAWFVDAIYYWHIDIPVVIGFIVIFFFFLVAVLLTQKYLQLNAVIKDYLSNPNQSPYGVLITEEYYFENTPENYHIIPRENIIRIDYEEKRPNNEIYLEILLDIGEHIEVRGVSYKNSEFDLKTWIEKRVHP